MVGDGHLLPRTALLALLGLAGCRPPARPEPSAPPAAAAATSAPHRPDTAALRRDIPHMLEASGVPGLSMAVVRNDRVVWTGAFGTVDDSLHTPVTPETVFEAASLSKPVFAYLVLRLADRGEFDLDRPLLDLVTYPRLAQDVRARRITGRMVLSHQTGLPNWGGDTLTLRFDPGTVYGYSGEGFVLLQKALERVTGRPLEDLARREVFEPLGMTRSSYVWQDRFAVDAAYGKDWLWRVAPANRYLEANAAYTLLTTAGDYGRFVGAVLTGQGLSRAMWTEWLTPVRTTSAVSAVGLGIRVEDRPEGRTFYHSGNNGRRFTCYMTGDLARGLGFVYFTNASNGTSLVEALAAPVLGQDHPAGHRSEYDRYDDPRLLALKSVRRAAVDSGPDAARDRLRAISANPTTRPSFDTTLELGAFLAGRGLAPLSIEVLRQAVADAPDSAGAHLALGAALESAGALDSAIASYRRAQALEGDGGDAERRIRWVEDRVTARGRPVAIPRAVLERYAGRYQERVITLRDGRPYYRRGANPESPLSAMAQDLFEVTADPTLRIRFVGGAAAPAAKLVEVSSDGTIDESLRSN